MQKLELAASELGDGVTITITVTVDLIDPIEGIEINDLIEIGESPILVTMADLLLTLFFSE